MKLSRDELKQIIKECMVEIFSESFSAQHLSETKKITPTLNKSVPSTQKRIEKNNNSNQHVNLLRTGNPILDSVIADTAKTTLPSMLEAEGKKNNVITASGPAERIVANTDPESLFGEEASSKWASLAFGDFSSKS